MTWKDSGADVDDDDDDGSAFALFLLKLLLDLCKLASIVCLLM